MEVDSENASVKCDIWKCDHCDETFTREYSLKRHVAARHSDMAYECEVCKKVFG